MRILLVTMGLGIGGAETHIVELAKGLVRRGEEVIVASSGGTYEKELEEFGIKHYTAPLNNKNIYNMYKSYKILKKIIVEEKINIVHGHARIPSFICGKLQKELHFPFVTTAHWTFKTSHGLKYLTNWGERTIAVSEDIKQYLLDNYKKVKEENIFVTVNGIDTEKFSKSVDFSDIVKEFDLSEKKQKIVYISRLDDSRALVARQLIAISSKLCKKYPNYEIVIVGGGDVFEELKEKVNEKNKEIGYKAITMTGGRSDINKFASMADIFIGVSRSALEAMACEKPIIIAGNEGYIGIFDESKLEVGISTNFCCRGTIKAEEVYLYDDLCQLISLLPEEKNNMGQYNRETVKKYYSVDKMVDDNLKMYHSIF